MTSIRKYSGEENLRRIRMQKTLTFIIVEGSDDVPIYESCISSMLPGCSNYDVVFSGGKTAIKNYLLSHNTKNAIFVIDRDFQDLNIADERVVSLDRYSIENYFICEEVIGYTLQFALGCKFKDALEAFSLDDYVDSITNALEILIKVIFYYQRQVAPNLQDEARPSWSDAFLCENKSWHLCNQKIQALIDELTPTEESLAAAEDYYEKNFALGGSIIENFPGKMLKDSLHRYIKSKVLEIRPNAKGKYTDAETTRTQLSAAMYRSKHLIRILTPVSEFVKSRELDCL